MTDEKHSVMLEFFPHEDDGQYVWIHSKCPCYDKWLERRFGPKGTYKDRGEARMKLDGTWWGRIKVTLWKWSPDARLRKFADGELEQLRKRMVRVRQRAAIAREWRKRMEQR